MFDAYLAHENEEVYFTFESFIWLRFSVVRAHKHDGEFIFKEWAPNPLMIFYYYKHIGFAIVLFCLCCACDFMFTTYSEFISIVLSYKLVDNN